MKKSTIVMLSAALILSGCSKKNAMPSAGNDYAVMTA